MITNFLKDGLALACIFGAGFTWFYVMYGLGLD